jgi:hypothetical protein
MIPAVVRRLWPVLVAASLAAPAAIAQTAQKPAARPAAAGAAKPAAPAQKPAAAAAPGPIGGGAAVETVGDWTVYTAQRGRSKICYALTEPKARLPRSLDRDKAYLFVTVSPSENVRNEIALVMGFSTSETAPAQANVGTTQYLLVTKDKNAWLKNPAEENKAIATMAKGQSLVVNVQSRRGNKLTDRYSLNGFGPALDRARKECGGR